jgi:hypothetical protein
MDAARAARYRGRAMLGFSRGGTSPFGWAATCAGRRPVELQSDLRALSVSLERAWSHHFPRERGYVTRVDAFDPARGITSLVASRGDFDARLTLEHGADDAVRDPDRGLRIRVYGRAASLAITHAEEIAERRVARGRAIGAVLGLLPFVGLAWLSVGVANPIFVLGGLLMVVALVTSVFVGATIGASLGERFGEAARRRAREAAARDPGVEHDLRRWKSLTRVLMSERAAFVGGRAQQPFRREHVG